MKKFDKNLIEFIEKCTCSYTCIKHIKNILNSKGYKELLETDNWNLTNNKYYIVRNDASIIAFKIPKKIKEYYSIITTHSDTPALLLKPDGAYIKENYLKYNVMPYGGLLNYGWLDHPLSLSGRVIVNNKDTLTTKIVDFKKPMLVVPSVAIHQKTDSNTNLDLNMQIDLQPIMSITKNKRVWDKLLKSTIKDEIIDYDLFTYNIEKPVILDNNLLVSPRIDNLTSVYSALNAFLDSNDNNIKVFCSFNNEEIGSLTIEGADSNFLLDILKRIASHLNLDIAKTLSNSFIVSSDNTHAIHLGKRFAIIKEEQSTTNSLSSSIIKKICNSKNIKFQDSTAKNDVAGGSTLSGLSLRHVSVLSIDVGIAELSMHSSVETCSLKDVNELYKMMKAFYETTIDKNGSNTKLTN